MHGSTLVTSGHAGHCLDGARDKIVRRVDPKPEFARSLERRRRRCGFRRKLVAILTEGKNRFYMMVTIIKFSANMDSRSLTLTPLAAPLGQFGSLWRSRFLDATVYGG